LRWLSGNRLHSVHLDHKEGRYGPISRAPTSWMQYHPCNEKNKEIFKSYNFGFLCNGCNYKLPGDINYRKQLIAYLEDEYE
jgi:hypothetical protein